MRAIYAAGTAAAVMSLGLLATAPARAQELASDAEKFGYAQGVGMGRYLKQSGIEAGDIDLPSVLRGIKDMVEGNELAIPQEELANAVRGQVEKIRARVTKEQMAVAEKYLAENGAKDGVQTTESGLQYEVITAGDGATPTAESTVTVHYVGTLPDGKTFDSSVARGEPTTFKVGQVIKGWIEGLQLMKVGSKYRFVIPPALAYGERGAGDSIGPNAVLIFEVELLKVE